ncbi:arsenate reductase (glutaredoxin) [Caulobacter sp. NIBR2454]|uniref:arsenate reductase (glutaredoxin) n=1 Tax=Caulobacter sp. NIBR2454 TaxID=3015996 RepID=UPI0022B5EFB9|nr:arsenate reductase (glutaredoxin) [Caulobacter sp. NIBR2454]
MTVTIFHNPVCSTSRKTLEALGAAGAKPVIVEYLKTGWTKLQLQDLLKQLKLTPRDILRTKGALAGELGLLEDGVSDDRILDAMVEHPVLVERPIVVGPKGAVVARPIERFAEVL